MNSVLFTFFLIFNFFLIVTYQKNKLFYQILDKPDGVRKLHKKPMPLAGGMIIFFNLLLYFIFLMINDKLLIKEFFFINKFESIIFFITLTFIFILGVLDDKFNLNPSLKFFICLLIIIFLTKYDQSLILQNIQISFYSETINLGRYGIFFTLFCFLVFLNAFNMFDGINLQSCLYSLIIFLNLFNYSNLSLLLLMIIISIISFSYLNFKNLSFLGDSGTLLIAFLISYFFIKLYNLGKISYADEIVIYMIIPGLDLIRLFVIRILRKKNPLSPDREHLHHLLLNKYSYNLTITIILALIIFPIILNHIGLGGFINLLLITSIYTFVIIHLKKTINNN